MRCGLSTRLCLLGVSLLLLPIYVVVKTSPNPRVLGVNRHFQAVLAKISTCFNFKTATKYRSPNSLHGWCRIFAHMLWQGGRYACINFKSPIISGMVIEIFGLFLHQNLRAYVLLDLLKSDVSVHPYVRTSTKSLSDFDLIWYSASFLVQIAHYYLGTFQHDTGRHV